MAGLSRCCSGYAREPDRCPMSSMPQAAEVLIVVDGLSRSRQILDAMPGIAQLARVLRRAA